MAALKQGDRYCNPLPLYHVGGMVLGSIAGIVLGMTIVYLGEAFDPLASLEADPGGAVYAILVACRR